MVRKKFLLVMLGTFLAIGGFWALRAQDPAPQQTPTTTTTPTEKQTMPKTTQLDLSGTYAGTFANCEGLNGDTTLTITGDQFTTTDGKSGRIIASKTKGYTAVALQMSGANSPVMSFRGKKSGNKLTLSPVSGATSQCMFTTSKSSSSSSTATGTTVANPTTTTPSQSPSPTPSPSPEASPEPNPSPSGSPRPGPSPSPSEPAPSPTPSPSPSPRM
jgi:hypothetical protein